MADLYQQAARFRSDLLAGERRAASELVKAYGAAYTRITGELDDVTAEIAKRRAAGVLDKDIPALLYRQGRLQVLQEKVRDEVGRFAGKADIIVGGAIGEAATKGQEHAAKLIDIALPEGVSVTPSGRKRPDGTLDITSLAPQEIGLATGAAEQATAVTRASAPVGRLFAELGPQGAKAATDALIAGVVAGKNPKVIARDMRGALGGNLTRALTIARTETLRAYREASRGVYQDNASVLRGWIWIADVGPRTCPSCFAQHGSVHDLSEVMATHPRCRCTMAPATKPWRELGFGDTPEAVQIEDGPTAFRRLSAADQRRVLGPAKYEAYTRREITLPDLVAKRQSPIWGPSTQEASLRAAKDNAALRRAGGGEPPVTVTELPPPRPASPDLTDPATIKRLSDEVYPAGSEYGTFERGEPPMLKRLLKDLGYDDLPEVVDDAQFERLIEQGAGRAFRGIEGRPSFDNLAESIARNPDPLGRLRDDAWAKTKQLREGEFFAGRGIDTHGTFMADSRIAADFLIRIGNDPATAMQKALASAEREAVTYANGERGIVSQMTLRPGAKIVNSEDAAVRARWEKWRNDVFVAMRDSGANMDGLRDATDFSVWASLEGYDAVIAMEGRGYVSVLNRGALIIKRTAYRVTGNGKLVPHDIR